MIKSFKHKGLRRFYESGSTAGIQAAHKKKLRSQLAALDTAKDIQDMDLPGYRLHPLKGDRKGQWATVLSGNWRITFTFEEGDVYLIDYEDYH